MYRKHPAQWLLALTGTWMIASPYLNSLSGSTEHAVLPGAWTFVVGGFITLGVVLIEYLEYESWQDWSGIMMGVGVLGAPWYAGFASSQTAVVNALVCGTLIIIACFLSLFVPGRP